MFLKMAADLSDYDEVFSKAFELTMAEKQERADMLYEFRNVMDVISEIRLNNQGLRQWLHFSHSLSSAKYFQLF